MLQLTVWFFSIDHREAEEEYEFRRQELVSNFDEMMRKREKEHQSKLDEINTVLLANELKVLYNFYGLICWKFMLYSTPEP